MTVSPLCPCRLAAALALSVGLAAANSSVASAQQQPLPAITVTSNAAGEALPFFYARAHGLFRKAGLAVHFTPRRAAARTSSR